MKLGDVVRDKISGFTGVANCRLEYLNGCVRWMVCPQTLHDGKVIDAHYFDHEQLEVVEGASVPSVARVQSGGDRPTPAARGSVR
jgi:hypothetical protein